MQITSLPGIALLPRMLTEGYIRVQSHPDLPLSIYNYTPKAAYEGVWNDITRVCRGLIVNSRTWEIVARPFPKFFNYGQEGGPAIPLDEPVSVTDKLDGSLGILYGHEYDWRIATRGSFTSEQAIHATNVFNTKYRDWEMNRYTTFLFEIIYPGNRIVCDYKGADDLYMLGAIDTETGRWLGRNYVDADAWPGPVAQELPYKTFGDALAAEPRPNAEGFVIYIPRLNDRVKVKQEDYVRLHRIITGLSERSVWELLKQGKRHDEICEDVPDEFHPWIRDVVTRLYVEHTEILIDALKTYGKIREELRGSFTRKAFAQRALASQNSWMLFALLDGKDHAVVRSKIWDLIRPEGNVGPSDADQTEDTE